jgi:hypothetical protein|tara:strand:- start:409 stop:585 length:177 start_codon:yes stop_codon:yes gene_type:complete
MKGVKHYFRDGTEFKGKTHKMPSGISHSGATHSKSSKRVYDYGELSNKSKSRARKSWG